MRASLACWKLPKCISVVAYAVTFLPNPPQILSCRATYLISAFYRYLRVIGLQLVTCSSKVAQCSFLTSAAPAGNEQARRLD
jgi:hypothetical protein